MQRTESVEVKRVFPSELALLLGLVGNSFAVAVVAKSNLGLTTTSLVSFALHQALPAVTIGTWNYLIQCGFIAALILLLRRVKAGYVLCFVLAVVYGNLIDLFVLLLAPLPVTWPLRVSYYLVGNGIMVMGITLLVRCRLPILPLDTFTRDLSAHFGQSLKAVRTAVDSGCFLAAAAVGFSAVRAFPGIGPGTVVSTLLIGTLVGRFSAAVDRSFRFAPYFPAMEKLIEE